MDRSSKSYLESRNNSFVYFIDQRYSTVFIGKIVG